MLQALLQSPAFLYRVEAAGAPLKPGDAHVALTDWEMASRLSYLLWGSMPDDELFAAAAAGKLRTKEEVLARAQRMIESPRARDMVANFHKQWLLLGEIDNLDKNTTVYPAYRPELRPLWRRETEEFVSRTILDEGGSLTALLTASHSFMNKSLADFYGVSGAPSEDAWVKVPLDPTRNAGFLTHAGHLAALSKPNQSSPVHRGKFVREQLLCQQLPPPPPNIDITPPDLDPKLTTRERFAQHSTDPTCKGCHHLMDPVGLGFEHYDGLGKWRDEENGLPIDDSGKVEEADLAVHVPDVFGFLGITDGHHDLSHHGDSDSVANQKLTKINNWFAQQFAYLVASLEAMPEGAGTMLDNSLLLWCNEQGKGNNHARKSMPWLLAGRAGGAVRTGRFLRYENVPHNRLLMGILRAFGVEAATFGDPKFCGGGPLNLA